MSIPKPLLALTTDVYIDPYNEELKANFTGQHSCKTVNYQHIQNINNFVGKIVISTGDICSHKKNSIENVFNVNAININEALPIIELANLDFDKRVFGVISSADDPNDNFKNIGTIVCKIFEKTIEQERVQINSLGEGAIWVCDYNGNLQNGDYITSSKIPGFGMNQNDKYLCNHTVAKITMSCDFNVEKVKKKKVKIKRTTSNVQTHKSNYVNEIRSNISIVYNDVECKYIEHVHLYNYSNLIYEYEDVPLYDSNNSLIIDYVDESGQNVYRTHKVPVYEHTTQYIDVPTLDMNSNVIYVDDLDDAGNIVYEDTYMLEYIDSNGSFITPNDYFSNLHTSNVFKAAFVSCTYHCG